MYRRGHPWVADHELSPKSVVRDMWERAMTFGEYVAFYGLARSRGLRAALPRRRLPRAAGRRAGAPRTEEIDDLVEWLGELVRQVDSSPAGRVGAAARNPGDGARRSARTAAAAAAGHRQRPGVPRDGAQRDVPPGRAGRARRDYADAGRAGRRDGWDADAWGAALDAYFEEYDGSPPAPTPAARRCSSSPRSPDRWVVRQVIDDPDGDHDWGIGADVDLAASDEAGTAVVTVTAVDRL